MKLSTAAIGWVRRGAPGRAAAIAAIGWGRMATYMYTERIRDWDNFATRDFSLIRRAYQDYLKRSQELS
jgi:hypothetical protein